MNLPKFNSADGRCYWMKPEVQEELQPLFDQCIQDAIDGRITRLDDSHWPPVVVSSQGAPFEVWQLLRAWTEIQRAETLDAEKAIAFSENLRRQSRWGEIDHHLLDMLKRELQEKYFVATGDEDDRFWDREYSLKPGIRAEQIPEPLLRFACYVAVSYKVYGLDFQYPYHYIRLIVTGISDTKKALVFLKQHFGDSSFQQTKDRLKELPLLIYSGLDTGTAPLENSLDRWGLMYEKQQISLEKFLENQAYIRNL